MNEYEWQMIRASAWRDWAGGVERRLAGADDPKHIMVRDTVFYLLVSGGHLLVVDFGQTAAAIGKDIGVFTDSGEAILAIKFYMADAYPEG